MSEKERGMSDVRERLAETIREAGEAGDEITFQCDCEGCVKIASGLADAILAEFDVTPRGVHNHDIDPACPETRLPDGSLRGECTTNASPPTVKPSVEDVAWALWELDEQEAETTGGALGLPWSALDSLTQGMYRADAEDLLAMLPGRTEAEVKAEAWDEVADYHDRTNAPSIAESTRRDNPYRAGEDECEECEAVARMIYSDPSDLTGPCSRHSHDRPAPVVPDSTDVRGELLRVLDSHGIDTYIDGTGAEVGVQNLITDILAVVGQGVTADIPERLRRAVARLEEKRDGLRKPDMFERARLNGKIEGVKLASSYIAEGERIFRAAVRPSGQEGS